MECRAYAIRMDSQSGEHLGKDRKVSSAAGGNLSGMHKTEKTVKESRMNYMYSHLCDGTLAILARDAGHLDEAADHAQEALVLARKTGNLAVLASSARTFASVRLRQNKLPEAQELIDEVNRADAL